MVVVFLCVSQERKRCQSGKEGGGEAEAGTQAGENGREVRVVEMRGVGGGSKADLLLPKGGGVQKQLGLCFVAVPVYRCTGLPLYVCTSVLTYRCLCILLEI